MFLGRKVRPGIDPLWLPTDREYALAWARNKAATCPSCGTRHDEWDEALGGDKQAYMPSVHACHGCAALAQAEVPTGPDGAPLAGHRPFLMPAALFDATHRDRD